MKITVPRILADRPHYWVHRDDDIRIASWTGTGWQSWGAVCRVCLATCFGPEAAHWEHSCR